MKYPHSTDCWTRPVFGEQTGKGLTSPLSFALFRTDDPAGTVVACRTGDRSPGDRSQSDQSLSVGTPLAERFRMDQDAGRYLADIPSDSPPLFFLSPYGLGILSRCYEPTCGLGLFLHIHARPTEAARLLNAGVLGDGETEGTFLLSSSVRECGCAVERRYLPSYRALLEAWQSVVRYRDGVFRPGHFSFLTLADVEEGLAILADFVGCRLNVAVRNPAEHLTCFDRRLLEALILCELCEVRDCSADHRASCLCEVQTSENGRMVGIRWSYPILKTAPTVSGHAPAACFDTERYRSSRLYVKKMAERGGFTISRAYGDPVMVDGDSETVIQPMTCKAVLTRPVRETSVSSDIKSRLTLSGEQNEGEIPVP